MISHILIKDFALIRNLSLDFHQGFHVITGETGAGKSILIEAVSLALGSRADTSYVRNGCDKAVIELTVGTEDPSIIELLDENGVDTEQPMVVTREISANGKSISRINGTMVSVSFLNSVCRKLADIHGQYDHQSLLNPDKHRELLDRYGAEKIRKESELVSEYFHEYGKLRRELAELRKSAAEREKQRDFMQFEWQEIHDAAPEADEDRNLEERLAILQNSERIYDSLNRAYDVLCEGESPCIDLLGRSAEYLKEAGGFSAEAAGLEKDLESSYYVVREAASQIRRLRDAVQFSQEELDQAQERLEVLNQLKRKYGGSLEAVTEYGAKLEAELESSQNNDIRQKELSEALKGKKENLLCACRELSALRRDVALHLEERVNRELQELNFKDAEFRVEFAEKEGEIVLTEHGMDQVSFLIRTNRGEPLKPLVKVASGGEISRVMLAFKSALGEVDNIPTLIFDEIDTGISGIAASVVGKKLRGIAEGRQVICITHLAQIAACGQHHYRIEKQESGDRIETTVQPVFGEESVMEIARLLGGANITDTTMRSARELLEFSGGAGN